MAEGLMAAMPRHLLTLSDWEAFGADEGHHHECSEGVLLVAPKPFPKHQVAVFRLVEALNADLRPGLMAVANVEVLLATVPLTVRAPDVVVTTTTVVDADPPRLAADDPQLVIEVMSEGSRRVDQVTKLSEYAEAGIPEYWIVDLGPPAVLSVHRLHPGTGYRLLARHHGPVELEVLGTDLPLNLDRLAAGR